MGLTRLEVVRREPFEGGRAFGETGPYERIDAVAHYAVDPVRPANARIVDLDRAERDADGKVRFSGDATFLVPVDPARPIARRCSRCRTGATGSRCARSTWRRSI